MERKFILKSKTFWVNAITLAVGAATLLQGSPIVGFSPELTAIITGLVVPGLNLLLRSLTNEGVTVKPAKKKD